MKYWPLFIVLFFSVNGFAQTGKIKVWPYIDYNLQTDNKLSAKLFFEDSLIDQRNIPFTFPSYENPIQFYSLAPGYYTFEIHINGYMHFSKGQILVKSDSITTFYAYLYNNSYSPIEGKDHTEKYTELFNNFSFGLPNKILSPLIAGQYKISQGGSSYFNPNKWLGFGGVIGYYTNYTDFYKDETFTLFEKKRERYFTFGLTTGAIIRLSGITHKTNDISYGPSLDFGVLYNLPFVHRHVYVSGNSKIVNRRIHNYTDFSGIIRIGFLPVTLLMEYRINNFIKSPLPQEPRFKLGLSLIFGDVS